jgi:RNA polymerase sigma factor (sigma-70 family)
MGHCQLQANTLLEKTSLETILFFCILHVINLLKLTGAGYFKCATLLNPLTSFPVVQFLAKVKCPKILSKNGKEIEIMTAMGSKIKEKEAELNSLLNEFLPHLRKVVKLKLKHLEKEGIIPYNMYSAQEIIDDVYLKIFENFDESLMDSSALKIRMYSVAKDKIEEIREKHAGKKVSFESLYNSEIKELEEKFSADADGEIVMIEDLDDISYHLDENKDNILLIDAENVDELAEKLDIENKEAMTEAKRKSIGLAYSRLPELSHSVVSHLAFGKLSVKEVAAIHKITEDKVNEIVDKVKTRLKGLL